MSAVRLTSQLSCERVEQNANEASYRNRSSASADVSPRREILNREPLLAQRHARRADARRSEPFAVRAAVCLHVDHRLYVTLRFPTEVVRRRYARPAMPHMARRARATSG